MKDQIIKGTGNSRCLKSVENFMLLYPTYADFVNALVAGTLPIDLNGLNLAGIQQLGDAINKGNLLKDSTAISLGLDPAVAVPDDAFKKIGKSIKSDFEKWMTGGITIWP